MESNYRIAYDKALEELRAVEPLTAAHNAEATFDPVSGCFTVPFFGRQHRVDLKSGEIVDLVRNRPCSVGAGIMIFNYLSWAKDIQPTGKWITLKEVPDGGSVFFPAFYKEVNLALAKTFSGDLELFERCGQWLGGTNLSMGHKAARFQALPKVPLAVMLWAGDEEVTGAANFLFDSTIEHFSPVETIIGFGYFLAHKLIRCAGHEQKKSHKEKDPFWDVLDD